MKILAIARQGPMGGAALVSGDEVLSVAHVPLPAHPGPLVPREAIEDCLVAGLTDPAEVSRVVVCGDLTGRQPFPPETDSLVSLSASQSRFLRRQLAEIERPLSEKPLIRCGEAMVQAAASYYSSPFRSAAVVVFTGSGCAGQIRLFRGHDASLEPCARLPFGHSPAALLDALGYHLQLTPGRYAYELAYLAAFGAPRYSRELMNRLIDRAADGSCALKSAALRMGYPTPRMIDSLAQRDSVPRKPEQGYDRATLDLARSGLALIRYMVNLVALRSLRLTECRALCLGGDFPIDLAENRILPQEEPFTEAWVQPMRGAAGLALGAALAAGYQLDGAAFGARPKIRRPHLGAAYSSLNVEGFLRESAISSDELPPDLIPARAAQLIGSGQRVGWFQGRAESGGASAGQRNRLTMVHRSALDGLRDPTKNGRIPEPLTLFVLAEHFADYFEPEPERSFTSAQLLGPRVTFWKRTKGQNLPASAGTSALQGRGPVRVLPVEASLQPQLYRLLEALRQQTGLPIVRAETLSNAGAGPVRTPREAYGLLNGDELDALVIANSVIYRMDDLPVVDPGPPRHPVPSKVARVAAELQDRVIGATRRIRWDLNRLPAMVQMVRRRLTRGNKSFWIVNGNFKD